MSKEKFSIPELDQKEFEKQVENEVEYAFEVLKIFLDSKSIGANQGAYIAVRRLSDNLDILNLKQKDWKKYGLDITKEKLDSLIKEYQKADSESLD